MAKLIFAAADIRRVVEHSIAAPDQRPIAYTDKPVKSPAIILVHDQGVYVMSNGKPGDLLPGGSHFVAYAEGCHPEKNPDDFYDTARDLVGGDDFADTLDWANAILKMLDDGATEIVIHFSQSSMRLSAVYPRGKAPKGEPRKETPDEFVKRIQRMTRTKVIAFDTERKIIRVFKTPPVPLHLSVIKQKYPTYKILNGQPTIEFYKAAELHHASIAAMPVD